MIPNPAAPLAPVPGGPGFISVSPYSFKSYNFSEGYAYSGHFLYNPTQYASIYEAPLALPHGATITKFVVYFIDNDSNDDFSVSLNRALFTENYAEPIVFIDSSGSSPYIQVLEFVPPYNNVVDNQNFFYSLEVFLPSSINSDVALGGIRVDYGYPSMLPLVQK